MRDGNAKDTKCQKVHFIGEQNTSWQRVDNIQVYKECSALVPGIGTTWRYDYILIVFCPY